MLGGRVKTLHPRIHAGLLATQSEKDTDEMKKAGMSLIDYCVCNLYPFEIAVEEENDLNNVVEEIDIGGKRSSHFLSF